MLASLGRVRRGAEAAFLEVAQGLSRYEDTQITLFGSGDRDLPDLPVIVTPCRPREKFESWPSVPAFRNDCAYEEFTYAWNLARSGAYRPEDFDVVMTCTYPWVNWIVNSDGRRAEKRKGRRPVHVYVTQNGDWPCSKTNREYRYFGCDGLVCTNPVFYERQKDRHRSILIPNGVDPDVFHPRKEGEDGGPAELRDLNIAPGQKVVVMASAMIETKDVAGGVRAVAQVPDAYLVVAGDGPERQKVASLASELLPGRHTLLGSVPRDWMPHLFRRGDAFLHMSRDEPSALVYLEAASSGLPMVVHDWSVTRWTLGDVAIYADTSKPETVALALREALSPASASRGAASRSLVLDGWSWNVLSDKYRAFFLELLKAKTLVGTPS